MLMPGMAAAQLPTAQHEKMEGLTEGEDAAFDEALAAYLQVCSADKVRGACRRIFVARKLCEPRAHAAVGDAPAG